MRQEKPYSAKLSHMARHCRTLSNRRVLISFPHSDNRLRCRASGLHADLLRTLHAEITSDEVLLDCEWKLRAAYKDPKYYHDNSPILFTSTGAPHFTDGSFSYFDFFGSGMSGHSPPYKGFSEELGLPLSYEGACALIGLLDLDAAVAAMDQSDLVSAGVALLASVEAIDEMRSQKLLVFLAAEAKTKHQKHAGSLRHKNTHKWKSEILREWETGRFQTKKDCIAWAINAYDVHPESVRRWLAKHRTTA